MHAWITPLLAAAHPPSPGLTRPAVELPMGVSNGQGVVVLSTPGSGGGEEGRRLPSRSAGS